jgi:hypothetical protein
MTLLLHPGFHKTATSWLQTTVFAEQRLFRALMGHRDISDLLVAQHDFDFDPAQARAEIARLRERTQPGIVDVISSEILSGNIIMGSRDCVPLAARLAAACPPPAKVLLTVRAQLPIMKSIYLQYIKRGGRLDIEEYLAFKPEPGYFWFDPGTLEFDRLVLTYAAHFGAENVMVLPQELLARDRARYLRLLCEFVGLDESEPERDLGKVSARGISPPVSGVPILRIANSMRQSPLNPASPSRLNALGDLIQSAGYRWTLGEARAERRIGQAISAKLAGRYGASNRRLQPFAPVDLAGLGYEMAV